MRSLICVMAVLLALAACDKAKEQGRQTVRTLSGGQMMDQKHAMERQLDKAEQQQNARYGQLGEQPNPPAGR
jgi:beta-lactamase class A